jgi:hypothetical protein
VGKNVIPGAGVTVAVGVVAGAAVAVGDAGLEVTDTDVACETSRTGV